MMRSSLIFVFLILDDDALVFIFGLIVVVCVFPSFVVFLKFWLVPVRRRRKKMPSVFFFHHVEVISFLEFFKSLILLSFLILSIFDNY